MCCQEIIQGFLPKSYPHWDQHRPRKKKKKKACIWGLTLSHHKGTESGEIQRHCPGSLASLVSFAKGEATLNIRDLRRKMWHKTTKEHHTHTHTPATRGMGNIWAVSYTMMWRKMREDNGLVGKWIKFLPSSGLRSPFFLSCICSLIKTSHFLPPLSPPSLLSAVCSYHAGNAPCSLPLTSFLCYLSIFILSLWCLGTACNRERP